MKKDSKERVLKPGDEIVEKVTRLAVGRFGMKVNLQETVKLPMVINPQGIKIRKQCSSCRKYQEPIKGKMSCHYCPKIEFIGPKGDIPCGRGLCSDWAMSDVYMAAGLRGHGRVKSANYIHWFGENITKLYTIFSMLPVGQFDWTEWHIGEYERATGYDIWGNKLNSDD